MQVATPSRAARGRRILDPGRWGPCGVLVATIAALQPSLGAAQGRVGIVGAAHLAGRLAPALAKGLVAQEKLELQESAEQGRRIVVGRAGGAPSLTVEIGAAPRDQAFGALASGAADIVLAALPATAADASIFAASGIDIRDEAYEQSLAIEAVAAIVAPGNPAPALSQRDLAAIFSGRITDWSAFGGAPGPITPYLADGAEADGPAAAMIEAGAGFGSAANRLPTEEEVAAAVANEPGAIGLVSLTRIGGARAVPIALECGLVVEASAFTALTKEYPLSREVLLYRRRSGGGEAADAFAAFAASDRARGVYHSVGMLNDDLVQRSGDGVLLQLMGAIASAGVAEEREALKGLLKITQEAERLSATFHFRADGLLDARSLTQAAALAAWLALPENQGRGLHLLGFEPEGGATPEALQRSRDNAEAVRRAILISAPPGFDPKILQIDGFGATAPAACPGAPGAERINRRVEAWLTR